jgi:hypothetical protein
LKSLEKVLDVIEFLAKNGHTGIREISAKLSVPPRRFIELWQLSMEKNFFKKYQLEKNER